ncbi:coenzyme A biosynthesis bifunctional protein coaBc [Oleiphilus messinensis]|uniref:Coenzyme A biosynthesis bifunctional protein CoaBC n=1 Tax=Oleiphilus messinensis TaxID=141451 RepID=A0A1Y0IGQ7_9GAMM|nr:bifunctional phosphopantothenoylcysteine decarboxylase/phosphopantothenate--cysteine ligase CoaBC [Oleiphilus messinensis]ARU58564.1 coenzyme A biosynthesis bifunctional protein coaBc [Oleiphilus messinensis]
MQGKKIVVGVTGGIAAYKSAELVRNLVKLGAQVQVVMTEGALAFIQPMTFQALSGRPVRSSLLDAEAEAGMGHIELAKWADLVLIAPATANFIARYSHGLADDLLTTLCLATSAQVVLVPAMNQAMWKHAATQRNIGLIAELGTALVWGPDEGAQACGDTGPGRMLEPEVITDKTVKLCSGQLTPKQSAEPVGTKLIGKHVVLTAGPTREALDPVRFISNHSSGKMGYALAEAAAAAGAKVTLISGPVHLACPAGVSRVGVSSAQQMYDAVMSAVQKQCDIFIATAAVADYRPESVADQKIKKNNDEMIVRLTRNPDIVAAVAALPEKPFTVGFAAETNDVLNYAKGKLARKNLDMIVANDVSDLSIGFNSDSNRVSVLWKDGQHDFGKRPKTQLAQDLIDFIADIDGRHLGAIGQSVLK